MGPTSTSGVRSKTAAHSMTASSHKSSSRADTNVKTARITKTTNRTKKPRICEATKSPTHVPSLLGGNVSMETLKPLHEMRTRPSALIGTQKTPPQESSTDVGWFHNGRVFQGFRHTSDTGSASSGSDDRILPLVDVDEQKTFAHGEVGRANDNVEQTHQQVEQPQKELKQTCEQIVSPEFSEASRQPALLNLADHHKKVNE
nr:hypothetical protein CFP56_77121 [Quercus suber]